MQAKEFYDWKILVYTLASTLYHQVIVVHFDWWNKLKWKTSGNPEISPLHLHFLRKKTQISSGFRRSGITQYQFTAYITIECFALKIDPPRKASVIDL